ncbi:hypothetical protein O1D18_003307 [Vibrio cholerae]|nr:hypothetical protein [Vibrio cholerae]EKF9799690.1 hypothetical protein [Vibrio cholerae]
MRFTYVIDNFPENGIFAVWAGNCRERPQEPSDETKSISNGIVEMNLSIKDLRTLDDQRFGKLSNRLERALSALNHGNQDDYQTVCRIHGKTLYLIQEHFNALSAALWFASQPTGERELTLLNELAEAI